MCYDYDKIMGEGQAKRNFNLDRAKIERIIGSRDEWNKALNNTFLKKPADHELCELPGEDESSSMNLFDEHSF